MYKQERVFEGKPVYQERLLLSIGVRFEAGVLLNLLDNAVSAAPDG